MRVKFEAILDGTAKFIDKEIYSTMNDWQEILARLTIGYLKTEKRSRRRS